jgi:ribose transport system substrate-binding protein
VFDRGVNTDCPVSFIRPIGGYAFGAVAANFIVENLPEGGNVLALRILPGVDVLEHRWSGAERIFADAGLTVVGAEFTEGSTANTKSIVEDYIQRFGRSTRSGWTPARPPSPRSRRSRTPAPPTRSSRARTSRTS